MKLLTKEIITNFEKAPLYSTDGQNIVPVIVKFFHPMSNWTWYAVEGSLVCPEHSCYDCTECLKETWTEFMFFGLVEGDEKEVGYFQLSELESVCVHGLKMERDRHFDGYVLNKKGSPKNDGTPTVHWAGKAE
jgi:hypothetical protein